MVGREIELVGGSDDELYSDAAYSNESCTGGGVDDDVESLGVYKVRLVVSPTMAPTIDVGVLGNPSND